MEDQIIEFVKSKMSPDNLDEIRTLKGASFGQRVQKSHHRNRSRQYGKGLNYIGSAYSNFVKESIVINDEMYEPNDYFYN